MTVIEWTDDRLLAYAQMDEGAVAAMGGLEDSLLGHADLHRLARRAAWRAAQWSDRGNEERAAAERQRAKSLQGAALAALRGPTPITFEKEDS